jgi:UDP-N-acetylmuramoyl-tripeptide--D-alanyl-D-alanine ligase
VGQVELWYAGLNKAWPAFSALARAHRRTLGRRTRLVTVVGSFGKTTTTRCITAALGLPDRQPRDNCRSHLALAVLAHTGFRPYAVLEVGIDHVGQMAEYARTLRPDVTVVTSIGSEHSRSLGALEGTRREKGEMVRALAPGGLAVLNGDDPNVMAMRAETAARTVTFGTTAGCEVSAAEIALDWPRGTRFRVTVGGEEATVSLRLLGATMVYPAVAAIAVARAVGVPLAVAVERLATVAPTPGRLDPVEIAGGVTLIRDDFKSAEETIRTALDALAAIPARRKLVVLGDVSEPRGRQGPVYRAIGARVASTADFAVFLGRRCSTYSAGAHAAGMARAAVRTVGDDVAGAARMVRERLEPGDVVLIKGRDNERLERVALALMGRDVRCDRERCFFLKTRCDGCSLLGRPDAAARTRHVFPFRR